MSGEVITGIFVGLSLVVAIVLARAGSRILQARIAVGYVVLGLIFAAYMSEMFR